MFLTINPNKDIQYVSRTMNKCYVAHGSDSTTQCNTHHQKKINLQYNTEAELLDVIGTKV